MCWTGGSRKWRGRACAETASWCDSPMILSSPSKTATAASGCLTCWANVSVDTGSRSMRPRRAMWTSAGGAPTGATGWRRPRRSTFSASPTSGGGRCKVRTLFVKSRRKAASRALKSVHDWCKRHRHLPIAAQREHLAKVIRGHCAYYGLTGNGKRLEWFRYQVIRIWRTWLARRSRLRRLNWDRMNELLKRYPCRQSRSRAPGKTP